MKEPQFLPLSVAFTAKVVRLFSWRFSQPENGAPQSSPNPTPLSILDDFPNERLMDTAGRPLPSNSTSFKGDELKVLDNGPIGVGGYADIWEATLDNRNFVVKSYRLYETGDIEHTSRRYRGEILVCSQLSHPNVVLFVGVASTPSHPLSLVFDTAGHHGLGEYLDKNPKANKLNLVRGIARGLKHVHDRGVVHGRLCLQNVLVSPDGTPRITGFGSAFVISRPDLRSDTDITGFHRGSAPELIRPPKPGKPASEATKESDMFAFGILTWGIFTEADPFSGNLDATVVIRVLKGDRPPRPNHCAGFSNRVWKVVKACWRDSPSRRMAIGEVVPLLDAEQSRVVSKLMFRKSPANHPPIACSTCPYLW